MYMKQTPFYLLVLPLMMTLILAPAFAFAKGGHDDDDEDDDRDDDSALEIEADIFSDMTIVKVEQNDKKTSFTTDADTRDEVVDAILARYDLSESEVEAALELEEEDRNSRPQDRGKFNREMMKEKRENKGKGKGWGNYSSTTPKTCSDDDSTLSIEANVFTDKTVVKVEFVNVKDEVFTTSATTSTGVVDAIATRYSSLTKSQIETALDFEIEDRASRDSDLAVDNDCKSGTKATSTTSVTTEAKLAELRARIAELQTMLDRLISLLRGN